MTGVLLVGGASTRFGARETFLELDLRTSRRGTRVLAPAGSNEVFSGALLWDLDEQVEVALLTSVAEFPAHKLLPELAQTVVGS